MLQRANEHGLAVPRRRALDFGCGVGRLTQALAEAFDRCDGVDISASMLDRRAANTAGIPTAVSFIGTQRRVFHCSRMGTFTFVYSTLVLQHMAPRLSIHLHPRARACAGP